MHVTSRPLNGSDICYRQLFQYAHDKQWFQPGHGDLYACLELYSKCQDGRFRREDHTGYKMPIFCTPLEVWSHLSSSGFMHHHLACTKLLLFTVGVAATAISIKLWQVERGRCILKDYTE